jgi:hypothetical protein
VLVNNAAVLRDQGDVADPAGLNTIPTVTLEVLRETFETNFFIWARRGRGNVCATNRTSQHTPAGGKRIGAVCGIL